jgi:hypothetical protein
MARICTTMVTIKRADLGLVEQGMLNNALYSGFTFRYIF